MLNLGFNHYIPIGMIGSILDATSSTSLKKFIEIKRNANEVLNTSSGRKTLSYVLTVDGLVYASAVSTSALRERYSKAKYGR